MKPERYSFSKKAGLLMNSGRIVKSNMWIVLSLFLTLNSITNRAFGQKKGFEIQVIDNAGIYNNRVEYKITSDSVQITGLADFGRTPVKYMSRKLTKKECKTLTDFIRAFPLDSLDDQYKNEFNPVDYDNKAQYPRIMQISITRNGQFHTYQTINCWVRYSDSLFSAINPLLPEEVKIKYNKAQFNAFY